MLLPKEKPKEAKSKKIRKKSDGRSQPTIFAKQAAKLMKDKYVQQLDQQQSETGSTEVQAVEQVEKAGTWAVDEMILRERPRSPRQRSEKIKRRLQTEQGRAEQAPSTLTKRPTGQYFEGAAVRTGQDLPLQKNVVITCQEQMGAIVPSEKLHAASLEKPDASLQEYVPPSLGEKTVQMDKIYQQPQILSTEQPDIVNSAASPKRAARIKERPAREIKEKGGQVASSIKQRSVSPSESIVSIESIHPLEQQTAPAIEQPTIHSVTPKQRIEGYSAPVPAQHTSINRQPAIRPPASTASISRSAPATQRTGQPAPDKPRPGHILSERKKIMPQQIVKGARAPNTNVGPHPPKAQSSFKSAAIKTKNVFYPKGISRPKLSRLQRKSIVPPYAVRQTAQRRMVQRAVQQVSNTVKAPAAVLKKTATVVIRAAAALINAVAALAGGGILLLALVVVVIVAAVANSPFGLFFAQEPNAPGTVSVAQAVGTVNMAYNGRLELLQAGDYDDIVIQGQAADWPDVLAVFAVKTAGADVDGLDVATLDSDRVDKLTAVFWDMTAIAVSEEIIDHPASGSSEAWSEKILHITITPRTADDMKISYSFSPYQISALDELLADRAALSLLAGDLTITSTDVRDILAALPEGLQQARQETVQTALQLVGKLNYFWGGKSRVIGWDSRWGQLKKVTAAGSSTTGTYRPFGLDCSGFVDWTFNNSLGYIIGHGGGARAQHTYCINISQSAAQPGDLAFYPDDSHVGIIVGRNAEGKLLVCHCSSGKNNVVVTEFSASGFTAVGRPDIFAP